MAGVSLAERMVSNGGGGPTTTACGMHLPGTQARQARLHCDVVPCVLEENISFIKLV